MYISITGLVLRTRWQMFRFYYHAIPSLRQAQRAEGNLHVSVRTIKGVHHTLSAWSSYDAMRGYVLSGAHKKAMGVFSQIASAESKIYSYEADIIPDWDEARCLYDAHARPLAVR